MTEKVFTWFAYNPKTTSSCQSVDTREETRAESYKFKRNSYIIVILITVKYQVTFHQPLANHVYWVSRWFWNGLIVVSNQNKVWITLFLRSCLITTWFSHLNPQFS